MAGSRRIHNDRGFRPWLAETLCGEIDPKEIHISKDHETKVYYQPAEPGASRAVRYFSEDETFDLFERYKAETAEE